MRILVNFDFFMIEDKYLQTIMEIIRQFIVQRIESGIVICGYKQSIHYEFGQSYIREYLNGELHGWQILYRDELRYISNKMQNIRVAYDKKYYICGRLCGENIEYYTNGMIRYVRNYLNKGFDMKYADYNRDGRLNRIGYNINGKDSCVQLRPPEGATGSKKIIIIDNLAVGYTYDDNCILLAADRVILHGTVFRHKSSTGFEINNYHYGLLHGLCKVINTRGKIRYIGKYYYGKNICNKKNCHVTWDYW